MTNVTNYDTDSEDDTPKDIGDELYKELNDIVEKWCNNYENNYSGGKMRQIRGADIEAFVQSCINKIRDKYDDTIRCITGSADKKTLLLSDITKQHQVDIHIYKKDKFIAVIECKAYLDSCYYVRACDDFRLFKKCGYDVKSYIFTLENSIDKQTKDFTDADTNSVCDNVFYMMDGKRSSTKPIYNKKYKKTVNRESLLCFIESLKNVLI